jgi:hypothetical protein
MVNQPEIKQTTFPEPAPSSQPMPAFEQPSVVELPPKPEAIQTPPNPEIIRVPETPSENPSSPEDTSTLNKALTSLRQILGRTKNQAPHIPNVRDELTVRVEKIMEEDLTDAFKTLSTVKKQEFKIKGEQTAYQIRELLNKTHVKIKKIFKLILEWLLLLPGINRFYLEQEAKIKADKILALKKIRDGEKK